jgi:hypothetical protein
VSRYPNPGPWDGPDRPGNRWGPIGRLTFTTWSEIGLTVDTGADEAGGTDTMMGESANAKSAVATSGADRHTSTLRYIARDVFSQKVLPSNFSGFVCNVTGFNATLVLVEKASPVTGK